MADKATQPTCLEIEILLSYPNYIVVNYKTSPYFTADTDDIPTRQPESSILQPNPAQWQPEMRHS